MVKPQKNSPTKKTKSAADLYRGTNRRLTIMVVLMVLWTLLLVAVSTALVIFAIQAYNTAAELQTQLKDESSTLYQVVKDEVRKELQEEIKNMTDASTSSVTEVLKNTQQTNLTDLTNYQNLLK